MEKENPRIKLINLLKWSSAAFIDTYEKTKNESDAVAASKVYMDEMLSISSNPAKMEHFQESGLKVENFAKHFQKKEEEKLPTDDQIRQLFSPKEDLLDFTSEFNQIFEENKRKKLSQESNPAASPLKKAKTDEVLSSQSQEDPFTSQAIGFSASTQMELDKIFSEEIPEYRPSPWKSDKIKTTATTSKFKNLNRRKIETEDNEPTSSKESLARDFANAYGSKSTLSSSSSQLPVKPAPIFSNPWSSKKPEMKKSPNVPPKKSTPVSMFANPWSKKPPQIEKKEKFSIGMDPFAMNKKTSLLNSETPSISVQNNPFELKKKPDVRKEEPVQPPPAIESTEKKDPFSSYSTARQQLAWLNNDKGNSRIGLSKKSSLNDRPSGTNEQENNPLRKKFCVPLKENLEKPSNSNDQHPLLEGIDKKLLERIKGEVVVQAQNVGWDDIIGLREAKNIIKYRVVAPICNPKMFAMGMAKIPRAILLFGPPGNGKTMIGKCMASEINATFMSISSSSLTSKWIGESETLVKALFAFARTQERTIIFFDEIDSMLCRRNDDSGGGSETMNRFKTEFLVQLDGINEITDDNVLLIGATNRPESIDEAMLRRFAARILIPLPDTFARYQLISHLLKSSKENHSLTEDDMRKVANSTEGFSGADIKILATAASFRVVRKYMIAKGMDASAEERPATSIKDYLAVLKSHHPTVAKETVDSLIEWNKKFGAGLEDDSDEDD